MAKRSNRFFPLSKRAWFYMILLLFCSWFSLWKSHFKVEHRADTATIRKAYLQKQPLWLGQNSRRKDDDSKKFWWKPPGNSGIIWNYLIWFDLRLSDSWMNYLEEGEPAWECSDFFVLALPATLRSLSLSSHVHLSLLNAIEAYVCSRPLKLHGFKMFQDSTSQTSWVHWCPIFRYIFVVFIASGFSSRPGSEENGSPRRGWRWSSGHGFFCQNPVTTSVK